VVPEEAQTMPFVKYNEKNCQRDLLKRMRINTGNEFAKLWLVKYLKAGVRFFKKIQDWIFKSERIRKWILTFFIN